MWINYWSFCEKPSWHPDLYTIPTLVNHLVVTFQRSNHYLPVVVLVSAARAVFSTTSLFVQFTHITRCICTPLENPITSDNLTKPEFWALHVCTVLKASVLHLFVKSSWVQHLSFLPNWIQRIYRICRKLLLAIYIFKTTEKSDVAMFKNKRI